MFSCSRYSQCSHVLAVLSVLIVALEPIVVVGMGDPARPPGLLAVEFDDVVGVPSAKASFIMSANCSVVASAAIVRACVGCC